MAGGGGTDVNASFSGSSSATSGIRLGNNIVTYGKKQPPWLWLGLAALVVIGFVIWRTRK